MKTRPIPEGYNALTPYKEGAAVLGEMVSKDQFYGDRTGSITDPFGHKWSIMTRTEDVSFAEMQKRSDAIFR